MSDKDLGKIEQRGSAGQNVDIDYKALMIDTPIIKDKRLGQDNPAYIGMPQLDDILKLPEDASRGKAPPEFLKLSPDSHKGGLDGAIADVKGFLSDLYSNKDSLHDHVRTLARSGMSPAERQQLAREEKLVKEYNANPSSPEARMPNTPMIEELNRRTTALEKSVAETAKQGMTPLQVAQLESGKADPALVKRYEEGLIATVAQYESKGSVPANVYAGVVRDSKVAKAEEDAESKKFMDNLPKIVFVDLKPYKDLPFDPVTGGGVADRPRDPIKVPFPKVTFDDYKLLNTVYDK